MPQRKGGRAKKMTRAGNKGGAAKIGNTVQPPLKVFIKLSWLDPKSTKDAPKKRPFPKDMEVTIAYEIGPSERVKIGEKGVLTLEMGSANARSRKSFSLLFGFKGKKRFIRCEEEGKDEEVTFGDLPDASDKGVVPGRVFALPLRFTMVASTWKVDDAHADKGRYNADTAAFSLLHSGAPKAIATEDKPLEVTLDPHWQYLRVEFFDRFYGHTDHSHKPVTTPALMFEGHRFARLRPKDDVVPDTQSNWTIKKGDHEALVQCVPWILQKRLDIGHTHEDEKKPDRASLLLFRTKEKTFVKSKSATVREITVESGTIKLDPERLKLYDLPKLWMSRNQWAWLSDNDDDRAWYQDLVDKETTLEKPLCLSLDDIVLTHVKDGKQTPAEVKAIELPLLFYHTFKEATGDAGGRAGASYTKEGIYKPGRTLTAAKALVKAAAKNAKFGDMRLEKRKVAEDGKRTAARSKPATEEGKNTAEYDRRREIHEEGNKKEDEVIKGPKTEADTAGTDAESAFEAKAVYPFSDIKRPGHLPLWHIVDYPHWTRLVVCQGDLFDVFDQRTHQDTSIADDGKHVVGARAAVRWYDRTDWVEPGTQSPSAPAVVLHPSGSGAPVFAVQPLYRQLYLDRFNVFGGADSRIGRSDVALLRQCDIVGGEEIATNLHYIKLNFTLAPTPPPPPPPPPPAPPPPPPPPPVVMESYQNDIVKNIIARWHGEDGVGTAAWPEFQSRDNAVKLKVRPVMLQQAIEKPRAHYAVNIEPVDRAWANGQVGTAALGPGQYQADGSDGWFTAAHETGHFMSLPDDYGENVSYGSYGQLDFTDNTAGLPYDLDEKAMMRTNKHPRARHFWFAAEWVRSYTKSTGHLNGVPMKIHHSGTYPQFFLPRHAGAPQKSYASWPLAKQQLTSPNKRKCCVYLYRLGKDATAETEYPAYFGGAAVDGIFVVTVKVYLRFMRRVGPALEFVTVTNTAQSLIDFFEPRFAYMVENHFNKKWIVKGTFQTSEGDSVEFKRCMLHFQPRYLVHNYGKPETVKDYTGKANATEYNTLVTQVKNTFTDFFTLDFVQEPAAPPPPPPPPAPPPPPPPPPADVTGWSSNTEYKLVYPLTNTHDVAIEKFKECFAAMIDVPTTPAASDFTTLVQSIFPNGTVAAK